VVGALVIARWSWGLMRDAGRVLLDAAPQAEGLRGAIRQVLERDGARIADLHVWQVGRGRFACSMEVATVPGVDAAVFHRALSVHEEIVHVTVEVRSTGP